MKTKTTRTVDPQGRVSIPGYLRELAGINPGDNVTVEVDDSGIHIYASADRCCICGEIHDADKLVKVPIGPTVHLFCRNCCYAIITIDEMRRKTK